MNRVETIDTLLTEAASGEPFAGAPGELASVFLISPRYRQELAAAVESSGRIVRLTRRIEDAARRFAESPALIAVVDARGALGRGLETARGLSQAVEERRGAMLVLLSRGDGDALAEVYASGATHFLISPFTTVEFGDALRFADRYVARMRRSGANEALVSAQAALAGSARWEWRRGDDDVVISPALAALLGEPMLRRIGALSAISRLAPPERRRIGLGLRRLLLTNTAGDVDHMMAVDGTPHRLVHHVRVLRGADDKIAGLSATVEDIDTLLLDRRLAQHFDAQTGLANQDYARTWVDQLLGGRSEFDPACIVVLLSISRFEQVNVSYGRGVADALLQAVARRLRRVAGEDATPDKVLIARLAGAEFAVAFAGPVLLNDAIRFSQQLGDSFERPFVIGGRVIHLACRMGIAAAANDLDSADTLFRQAGTALAHAKTAEPNSFQVFLPGTDDDSAWRMAVLQADLRRALDEGELEILFQPQVEIVSGRITGVEALVRWQHPLLGTLSAQILLEVAERAELSARVGEHIIARALAEAARWPVSLGGVRLSVNVTAEDVQRPGFANTLEGLVEASEFSHERLTVEVTESGLVENLEVAAIALADIRGSGVRVAIDDFGTGYSSLAYLKALPLDYLKVDKSLVTDIGGSMRDRVVVHGVVDMARSLGLGVIAEGVETIDQLEPLVRAGCNWYQGYLCSPPLAAGELADFVLIWNAAHRVSL